MSTTSAWQEVGPGCFARRYAACDLTVGVVRGSDGLLVVDTGVSAEEGARIRRDLTALSTAPVRWVVNTHWHYDHCFGNTDFTEAGAIAYGHETVPRILAAHGERIRAELARRSPEWAQAMADTPIVAPTQTFSSVATIDLGDRAVELVHTGPGHTDGDVVVRVPDADVVYAGDVVEESGPPAYGGDSFPLEWPDALDVLLGLTGPRTQVVPGHGSPVGLDFVRSQRSDVATVAATIRDLAHGGVLLEDALKTAGWPYPPETLVDAVRRGYEACAAPNPSNQPTHPAQPAQSAQPAQPAQPVGPTGRTLPLVDR